MSASPAKPTLEEVTGYLGIGSLEILGMFFIIDGRANFVPFAEPIVSTTVWALLATVPLLVVSYVLGLISSLAAEAILTHVMPRSRMAELFADISTSGIEPLIQRFADVERHSRFLYGCTFAFIVLAIGCWSEVAMLDRFGFVGYLCLAGGIVISFICPLLALRLQRELAVFSEAALARLSKKETTLANRFGLESF